jgi:hypothetical protein
MKNFLVPCWLYWRLAQHSVSLQIPSKIQTIQGYADSRRLLPSHAGGRSSPERIECSQTTHKQGAAPQTGPPHRQSRL